MEFTYEKFIFRVKRSYLYHPDECWVKRDDPQVVVGVTDFFQKTVGDAIFIEIPEVGTEVTKGDEAGMIETIKVNVTLISPISGAIEEVNAGLRDSPQWVNTDPYDKGWLFKVAPANWEADRIDLLEAQAYFTRMKEKISNEILKK
jgi:glycine cleavage system H protein